MGEARVHLRRWREAGLLDQPTAERIMAFEESEAGMASGARAGERPTFTEVLVYLGIAIVGAGVLVLAATNWGEFPAWAQISAPGIPAVAATWAGTFMRRNAHPGLRRGGLAAWAAAAALIAGTVAVALNEAGVVAEDNVLLSGAAMAVVAFIFWRLEQSDLQVAAGAVAGLLLSIAAAAETSRVSEDWAASAAGATMLALGALGVLFAELGLIRPRFSCRFLGGIALAMGGFYAAAGSPDVGWVEVLPFAAGGTLVWLSVKAGFFPYAVLGIIATFCGILVTIFRHVSDPTLASLALMATGVVLIAAVIILARRRTHGPTPRAPGGSARPAGI